MSRAITTLTSDTNAALFAARRGAIVLSATVLIALCAHVALPLGFTPVPLTLGPLAVLIVGLALSPRRAAATLAVYLAEGIMGLPVFAPGAAGDAGLAHLIGPTGGYLVSYPLAVALISALWRSRRHERRSVTS